jgi:hypothetical protein
MNDPRHQDEPDQYDHLDAEIDATPTFNALEDGGTTVDVPHLDEPEPAATNDQPEPDPATPRGRAGQPPGPVNWNQLTAAEAETEWLELNAFVDWMRHTFGLPAAVIPPFWHRHPELVWEYSAFHTHFLCAYDKHQNGSAPIGWMRDFADARARWRDWVTASGTRLDRDRPTRQTVWPGEEPAPPVEDLFIAHRDQDFVDFILEDTARRQRIEDEFFATLDAARAELPPPA